MLTASAAHTTETEEAAAELSLADALSLAVRLHRSGDLDQALKVYQRILEVALDESNALHFLGVLTHQRGDTDAALALIRRSINNRGRTTIARNNKRLVSSLPRAE